MKSLINNLIGWYGTIAIVGGYTLVSFNLLQSNSVLYQFLNLTGALGIIVISLNKKAYQPAVLNIIWAVVAIVALARIFL